MVKHHSSLVCFFCLIWICLSWQRPLKVPRFKRNDKAESVKIETIEDPKAVKQFLVNPKKDSEEFRPVTLPENFSLYDNRINDNFISLPELIKTTGARRNAKEAFKDADRNGDGKISPKEFQEAPWALNISEIEVNPNISNAELTDILEEDPKHPGNGSLKIENVLDAGETEDKMNNFGFGKEDSTDIRLKDSSENSNFMFLQKHDSQMEDNSENQMKVSSESQLKDNFENISEESSMSELKKIFKILEENSSEMKLEDSSESQLIDSSESQSDDISENILVDNFESQSDDTSESQLIDSSESQSDDTSESQLVDSSESQSDDTTDNILVDSFKSKSDDTSEHQLVDSSESQSDDTSESQPLDSFESKSDDISIRPAY